MLVPYSKAQSAIGFRSRPILSLNLNLCGLPKSSLIDGQITHLSIEQPIEIIAHHPTAPVIILSEHECRIFTPEWKEHIQLCEDTLDLHGLIGSIGMLTKICPETIVVAMGLQARINLQYQNALQQREQTRAVLDRLRQLTDTGPTSIILLRFHTKNRATWGSDMTLPSHPIQHFRNTILKIKLMNRKPFSHRKCFGTGPKDAA